MSAPQMIKQRVNKTNVQKKSTLFIIAACVLKKLETIRANVGSNIRYPVITVSNLRPIKKERKTVFNGTSSKLTLSISVRKRMKRKRKNMLKTNP